MELRFRKLISAKHERTKSKSSETDTRSCSSHTASTKWSLRAFSPHPGSNTRASNLTMPENSEGPLQSVPYDTVAAGRAPTHTSRPVKGNGPIKLQTSRRLSSGDFSAAVQDNRQILEDIREGDCIIGQRGKHSTRGRSIKDDTPPAPALSTSHSYIEPFLSPRTPPETPAFSPSFANIHEETPFDWSGKVRGDGQGIATSSIASLQTRFSHLNASDADLSMTIRSSRASTATSPSVQVMDERNATITALWKAEYNRLVEIYGRNNVERRMPTLYGNAERLSSPQTAVNLDKPPSAITLEPLPHPGVDNIGTHARRLSNVSAVSSTCHDDHSDASSNKRASLISSCAASSLCTTQTGGTDHDSVMTREDIHKIVNEMRSNYLRALDKDAPSAQTNPPTRKKRQAKPSPLVMRYSGPLLIADRQALRRDHTKISTQLRKYQPTNRAMSEPFARPSTIEPPSSSHETGPAVRLQRADSTTLGSATAKIRSESETLSTPKDIKYLRKTRQSITSNQYANIISHEVAQAEGNLI